MEDKGELAICRDTFERLHTHHTVASLAQRIDFDLSMLEYRKNFHPSRFKRRHSVSTSTPATEPARTPSAKANQLRPFAAATTKSPKQAKSALSSPTSKADNSTRSPPALPPMAPSSSSTPKSGSNSKKKIVPLSRMFAADKPAKDPGTSSVADVNSTASTVLIENTEGDTKPKKGANLTIEVGLDSQDAEDDLLNSILDSEDAGVMAPAAEEEQLVFGATSSGDDDVDPGTDLTEQETVMMQALERAVEEFETAAAVGTTGSLEEDDAQGGAGELLEAAAKTVASAHVAKEDFLREQS